MGCQRMQAQEHRPGPAFPFAAITKITKFKQCLLLLALGIVSGVPLLLPGSSHGSPKCFGSHRAPAEVGRSCSSGGVDGWPCCRIQAGDSAPPCTDLFSCFILALHRESAPNANRQGI